MTEQKQRDEISVLTIGNSFTDSLMSYFAPVVESAGCRVHFERANHGGCELHRHWKYIECEKSDGVFRMYQNYTKTMREILSSRAWDVVTIQQASHASWRPETFEPFATNIINYIKEFAPAAEICIQQTWAYRADDPRIMPGGEWQIDQQVMYRRLTENYLNLSRNHGNLRIIPTGKAVQLARHNQPQPFANYAPELMQTLVWPDLPPQAWSLVGTCQWCKNAEGKLTIRRDCIHLNERGKYLQACVWFAFLFGRSAEQNVTFVPDCLADDDAAFLRKMADLACQQGIV